MNLEHLSRRPSRWLSDIEPDGDIVISSRTRLARNLEGLPFLGQASDEQRTSIIARLEEALGAAGLSDIHYFDLSEADSLDRLLLVERHLISKELAAGSGSRGVAFEEQETRSILVNEEDHLRIQVLRPGMALQKTYDEADRLDDILEKHLSFAFSPQYGYLTACPSNVGTGLRVSLMVHLPALGFMKQIDKVFQAVSKIGLAVRGLYGEGTQALGDFYQISNQVTLGQTEADLIDDLARAIPKIVEYERRTRETWMKEDPNLLEDRVMRALGMLTYTRRISSEEMMDHLSAVRMGIHLNVIHRPNMETINELFFLTQPAHLQIMHGERLGPTERDVARALFLRSRLGSLEEQGDGQGEESVGPEPTDSV
jgi:protein arginine kinase